MQDRFKLDIMLRNENETDEDFEKQLKKYIQPIMEEAMKKHLIVSTKDEIVKELKEYTLKALDKCFKQREKNDR